MAAQSRTKQIKLKYDTEVEITLNQYVELTRNFPGEIATRTILDDKGGRPRRFFKPWLMRNVAKMEYILNNVS